MRLNDYDDFIEYVLDEFEIEDDITVICDYKLADILNYYFGDEEYCEYKGINLQSDINEYYVTKFGKDFFCITPIKYDKKIKTTTGDYFIIDNNILEDNPTLFNYLEGNNFRVEVIDYGEDSKYKNKLDEEDLLQLVGLICEYTQLILDNESNKKTISYALTEFGKKILNKFCLEKIEE
ncbi:hypothetical protein [Clostridium botulinum]|uniref:hypothetical protein n=1 Tax=Clostridium botulinum TaxID=1491 RepID=UPI001C9B005C|nr:hypothetical protein [Clostridium botulinum]MBY6842770.1 hypothetical protein [Clostridium botulinum]